MAPRYPVSRPSLLGREREYVLDAIDAGWISGTGAYVERFEQKLGELIGLEEPLATCNGTAALHLACLAMGLGPGQEVIVPGLTYVATANAVSYCGARAVLADVDEDTWNVTANTILAAVTPATVGVIVVHLYGFPCDMEAISAACRSRGLWLIEDCAESLGASIRGHATGGFGDAATFSFYGNKTVTTGEGGAVYLRDAGRRDVVRRLRGQGMDLNRRYWHPIVGYNYRMPNLCAAVGLGQLEMADHHLAERRRVAAGYGRAFAKAVAAGAIRLQAARDGYFSSFWLFSLVLEGAGAVRRDAMIDYLLLEHGIETRPFFIAMNRLPMYADRGPTPVSDRLSLSGVNLPSYSGLPDAAVEEVAERVIAFLDNA